ncbi:MAG TPA: GNAT family N-acetyltransferase [Gemmatimonadales bacterium]|jgi:GNAT superfamily N-acetyltransferase|nr:GNAT family N-acetyltransferase [Gemmatimonadales bacterium]
MTRLYDAGYRERVRLDDGTEVLLRLLTPDDTALVVAGFDRLSEGSRYMRCMAGASKLTPADLAHLSGVDQDKHLALAAVRETAGHEEPAGLAELVRLDGQRDVAEIGIAVVDALQGHGLGRILLQHLIAAARERGVRQVRFEVLSANARMRNLLHEVAPGARIRYDGPMFTADVSLAPEADGDTHESPTALTAAGAGHGAS